MSITNNLQSPSNNVSDDEFKKLMTFEEDDDTIVLPGGANPAPNFTKPTTIPSLEDSYQDDVKKREAEEAARLAEEEAARLAAGGSGTRDDQDELKSLMNFDDNDDQNAGQGQASSTADPTLVGTLEGLVKDGHLELWVDEQGNVLKELKDMTPDEIKELIVENINHKVTQTAANAPVELFKQFPEEIQAVIGYHLNGATPEERQTLFKQLAQMDEQRSLNPEDENDRFAIIREYLRDEGVLSPEEIEKEVGLIADRGDENVLRYAKEYKKKLDDRQAQKLSDRLAKQAQIDAARKEGEQKLNDLYLQTLQKPELSGLQLSEDARAALYYGLTGKNYQTMSGKPTNELGYRLEQAQVGTQPDPEAVAMVLMILRDKKAFLETVKTELSRELNKSAVGAMNSAGHRHLGTPTAQGTPAPGTRTVGGMKPKPGFRLHGNK